jgi:hypothetical protein
MRLRARCRGFFRAGEGCDTASVSIAQPACSTAGAAFVTRLRAQPVTSQTPPLVTPRALVKALHPTFEETPDGEPTRANGA